VNRERNVISRPDHSRIAKSYFAGASHSSCKAALGERVPSANKFSKLFYDRISRNPPHENVHPPKQHDIVLLGHKYRKLGLSRLSI